MDKFEGRITSSGFESGDRVVIGDWAQSPLGPFTNIMWAQPDGKRVLLSPSKAHADYVSELYNFEEISIVDIEVQRQKRGIDVSAGPLSVSYRWKRGMSIPLIRPRWFIATIENFFAGLLYGTKTHGLTCNGLREWYCIRGISSLRSAKATHEGGDLGEMRPFEVTACFGFSEPPKKPSSVRVRSMIESDDERRV
tara:strand:- start:781 stop:1365 length:585 start_codon:yes stop_codon:yes gene_type:complete